MNRFSRLPVRTSQLLEPGSTSREPRFSRTRASSTSRSSSSLPVCTPSLRRSKSSASFSLKRTPQSVQGPRTISADRQRIKKKDDRPIQDKKWQTEMLRKTQEYFQNDPQGSFILNQGKNIRPITNNMFVQLVNIILKNIDERFEELTTANYVELLPKILTKLMYPANVTSSMMKTANTRHNWPHILAILSWLVELYYHIGGSVAFFDNSDNMYALPTDISDEELRDLQIQQLQSKVLKTAFVKWNKGEETDEVFKTFSKNLKDIYIYEYEEIQNLKQMLEIHTAQKTTDDKKMRAQKESIEKEEKECEKFTKNFEKAEETVAQQKEYLRKQEIKIAKIKEDVHKLREVNEKYKSEILELNEKIKKQRINIKDRDNMLQLIETIKAKKDSVLKKREQAQQLSDEYDLQISQTMREMEEEVSAYNIKLFKPGVKYRELNCFAIQTNSWLGSEVIQCLQEKIEKSKKFHIEMEKRLNDKRHSLTLFEKQNLQQHNEVEKLTKAKKAVQLRIDNIKNNIQISKEESDKQTNHLEENIESIEDKISDLKECFPDEEEINKQIKIKAEKYQILKTKFKKSALAALDVFETLERAVENNIIPGYADVRNDVFDGILKLQKMKESQER